MNDADIEITVPCAELEGNKAIFETSSEGLVITSFSLKTGGSVVSFITKDVAKDLLEELLAALNQGE